MANSSRVQSHLRLPVWNQWRRQMAATPLAEVEDSLLLRGLVQALVVGNCGNRYCR